MKVKQQLKKHEVKKRRKSSFSQLSTIEIEKATVAGLSTIVAPNSIKSCKSSLDNCTKQKSSTPIRQGRSSKDGFKSIESPPDFFKNDTSDNDFFDTSNVEDNKDLSGLNNNSTDFLFKDDTFGAVDLSMLEKNAMENSESNKSKGKQEHLTIGVVNNPPHIKSPEITRPPQNFAAKIQERLKNNAQVSPMIKERKVKIISPLSSGSPLFYGLPIKVKELLASDRKIESLYAWQDKCLNLESEHPGKNLIYSLPTSGGKTLVAEILIMKMLMCQKRNAVLVVPFVAIAQEKVQSIALFACNFDFIVEEYAGSKGRFPPMKRRSKNVLYICTMEKANSLVNSLIEENRLSEVGLFVVDELHMLGEGEKRGATLESMLTKVLVKAKSSQIIGMSATIGNIKELAQFLNAETFTDTFRPVELSEYVKAETSIFRVDSTKFVDEEMLVRERFIQHQSKEKEKQDSDHLVALVREVIPKHSCLVFCPTKKNCENVSLLISKLLPKSFLEQKSTEKQTLLNEMLLESEGVLCPILQKTLPFGVAYHHSGLTSSERQLIESAYRKGIINVIACTSTLAAGVNLPARRVIVRSPYVGRQFLSCAQYKQMIGRAGRAGIDTKGESYLIVSDARDKEKVMDLLRGRVEVCISSLMYGNAKGFKALLLNLIGLKIVTKQSEVHSYFNRTLFSQQTDTFLKRFPDFASSSESDDNKPEKNIVEKIVDESVAELVEIKLVQLDSTVNKTDQGLCITPLGAAVHKGAVDIYISNQLHSDLEAGLQGLVLKNYLHLLYLVTPYDAASGIQPDWFIYLNEINNFTATDMKAATTIGVTEHYIALRASGRNMRKNKVNEAVVKRFYVTIMLYKLFKGQSIWQVASDFQQPRGFLQSLMSSTIAFASSTLHFAREVSNFWPYVALLEWLMKALQFSTSPELATLMEVPGVKLARAKQLQKLGFQNLHQLANASPNVLSNDMEHLSLKQAEQIIAAATVLRNEKINTLEEEIYQLQV